MEQSEIGQQVDHLLLVVVIAPGRTEGRQAERPELLLVEPRIGAGREQEHDLTRGGLARLDELVYAARDVTSLGLAPVRARLGVARLVGHEQLDRGPEGRIGEAAGGVERLEGVAEVGREEVVDHLEHLGPRAVVLRQRQDAADLLASLAEDLDVRVPEAVDGLELVPDEEQLGVLAREKVDQLALEAVRVLELVHHDRAEAPALALADLLVVAQELAREQLQVFEVEGGLAILGAAVGTIVGEQELLELLSVPRSQRLERCFLDRAARLFVGIGGLAGVAELAQVEQLLRPR